MKPHQAVGIILLTSEDLNKKVSFFNYIFFHLSCSRKYPYPAPPPLSRRATENSEGTGGGESKRKQFWKMNKVFFRKMHDTVNSIFNLKMLIKPQKHRNLHFSCFIDFRKAFDCIPRQKLFDKLGKKGVRGRFLDVLISMYSNDKSAVKIDNKLTESFTCHAGVKQGCMLSPTLFNFYLSDLPKFLNTAIEFNWHYAKW